MQSTSIEKQITSNDGRLRRTFKDGQSKLNGYLEDYAFYVNGLLDLFAAIRKKNTLENQITQISCYSTSGGRRRATYSLHPMISAA